MKRVEQRATAQSRVLAAMMEAVADASGGTTESEVAYIGRQGEKGGDAVSYYESQLRRLAPYVQKRLGHFLQPRTFLHVEGHSAPCASAEELEVQKHEWADARPSSAPPVEYFPPPPQTQMWASIPTTTAPSLMASTLQPAGTARKQKGLNSVASGSAHSYGPSVPEHSKDRSDRADGENAFADEVDSMTECLPCGTVCTATPSELPCDTPVGSIDGDVHEKRARTTQVAKRGISQRHQQSRTEAGAEHGDNMQSSGPAMEMSTRSLFFQTRPHELLQGTVTLCNTGTTTIYFSWVPVDTIEEQLRQLDQDSGAAAAADSKAAESGEVREKGANKEHRQTLSDRDGTDATRITHSLAVHQRTARETFFFLSSPMNGVVLPGEEGIFAFSVRANRAGLFQHTYELLTVPPAPERIFVCLRALVQSDGPSFERSTQYIGTSLYIDDSGAFKDLPLNYRASKLAQREIRGDAFLLSNHDDPALDEWGRVDCPLQRYEELYANPPQIAYDPSNQAQMTQAAMLRETETKKISLEDYEKAQKAKEDGNRLFAASDLPAAVQAYSMTVDLTDGRRDLLPNEEAATQLRLSALLNRCLCFTRLKKFPEAVKDAQAAAYLDPKSLKAYYRLTHALCGAQEYEAAAQACEKYAQLGGAEEDVTAMRTAVAAGEAEAKKVQKQIFSKMFRS